MMFIDTRETRGQIPDILKKINVPITITPLDIGDYVVTGPTLSVCTESKTAEDYLGSISNNQLNSELYQMSCNYDINILMVYGSIDKALMKRKVKRRSYYEYLAGCIIRHSDQGISGSISVVNFDRVYDACLFLKTIHNMVCEDKVIRNLEAKKFKITEETRNIWVVRTFHKFIGELRAKNLLEGLGSIKNIVNATEEQLSKVDNIGDKISKDLYQFFNKEEKRDDILNRKI